MTKTNAVAVSRVLRKGGFLPAPPTRPGIHVKAGDPVRISTCFFESVETLQSEVRMTQDAIAYLNEQGYVTQANPSSETIFYVLGKKEAGE